MAVAGVGEFGEGVGVAVVGEPDVVGTVDGDPGGGGEAALATCDHGVERRTAGGRVHEEVGLRACREPILCRCCRWQRCRARRAGPGRKQLVAGRIGDAAAVVVGVDGGPESVSRGRGDLRDAAEAGVGDGGAEGSGAVELADDAGAVAAVGDIDVAAGVDGHRGGSGHRGRGPGGATDGGEAAGVCVDGVRAAGCDEDVAVGSDGDGVKATAGGGAGGEYGAGGRELRSRSRSWSWWGQRRCRWRRSQCFRAR